MSNIFLYILFIILLPLSLSQSPSFTHFLCPITLQIATLYVDETSKSSHPNGSLDRPFTNLDASALKLKPGTFDIILLGQSLTIISEVQFSPGSIYIVRPQTIPESGYYPLKFNIRGSINIQSAKVTFQNIQFVELDPDRGLLRSAIEISGGSLFLNRTLVSDIQYQETANSLITAYGLFDAENSLLLIDSQFQNLRNVKIYTDFSQVTVQNTNFEDIEMAEAFLVLGAWSSGEATFRMSNISLMNAKFAVPDDRFWIGFVHIEHSNINVSLDGFSVKNISLQKGAALITMYPHFEAPEYPTRMEIWDVTLEEIAEIENEELGPEEGAMIFNLSGPVELTVRNLTATNIQFKNGFLLKYAIYFSTLSFPNNSLSQISLQNIKISNSSNTNFLIQYPDSGRVENVELVNVTSNTSPVFSFEKVGAVSMKSIYGRNISGSLISLEQVFSQNIENIKFENVSTSQENSLIRLTMYLNITEITEYGIMASADPSIVMKDFFIDGFEYIGAEEEAYLMTIEAEIGTVLIRDSLWRNINTGGGLLSHNMSDLKVDNLTVKSLEGEGTLVNVNSGLVVVNNSSISDISGQLLFDLKKSSVKFNGTRINDIDCSEVKEACIVNGESVVLEWEDTEIADVVLQGDLVILDEKSVEKGEVTTINIIKVE